MSIEHRMSSKTVGSAFEELRSSTSPNLLDRVAGRTFDRHHIHTVDGNARHTVRLGPETGAITAGFGVPCQKFVQGDTEATNCFTALLVCFDKVKIVAVGDNFWLRREGDFSESEAEELIRGEFGPRGGAI